MKQKLLFVAVLTMAFLNTQHVWAFDFSAMSTGGNRLYYDTVDGYAFTTHPGNYYWEGFTEPTGNLIIPDSVFHNGRWYIVKGIKQGAFATTYNITSITIPRTITVIENSAFTSEDTYNNWGSYSNQMNAVYYKGTIAEWCNINFGGLYANPLYGAHHLYINNELVTNIIIPEGVDSIKCGAFMHMYENSAQQYRCYVDTIILPNSLKYIGPYAFEWLHYDKHLIIPDSVQYIGRGAFNAAIYGSVSFPQKLDTIRDNTFSSCLFTNVTLPSSLKYIGNFAFSGCKNLQFINIPASVEFIGDMAFSISSSIASANENSNLEQIFFEGRTPPNITTETFLGNWRNPQTGQVYWGGLEWISERDLVLTVPCQSVNTYKEALNWEIVSDFVNPMDVCQWDITVLQNIDSLGSVSGSRTIANGQPALITAIPKGGTSFIGWDDGSMENPREIIVISDTTLTALFAVHDTTYINVHDTTYIDVPYAVHDTTFVDVHDTTYINVHDTTYINIHDTTYIDVPYAVHDTTFVDVHDTTYINVHDTTYINIHDTTYIDVPYAVHDTTYINVHDTTYIDVPYAVHDTTYVNVHDTTYIDVPYAVHDTTYITLTDTITNTLYDTITNTVYDTIDNFIHDTTIVTDTLWLTQYDTLWLHDTIIVHDTIYITQEGIGDVEAVNVKVYSHSGQIVVEGADGRTVALYDINGRLLATRQEEFAPLHFDVPASGTYMLRIGNLPARKVVVIR